MSKTSYLPVPEIMLSVRIHAVSGLGFGVLVFWLPSALPEFAKRAAKLGMLLLPLFRVDVPSPREYYY